MGYINIFVSNDAHISIKSSQLFLKNNQTQVDYPLEDINSVMIESLKTTISTHTLSELAKNGILTFICNPNHLPCGVVLPFCEHYQTLTNFKVQIEASKPLQKQLWQNVVKNKIENQNEVLNICGGSDELKQYKNAVLSGDSSNEEAKASLVYFKRLFGDDFKRRDNNIFNSFLNYGYSIIRGFVARSLTVHGLMPFLGINHSNQFNQYNLADDLMEVFRPLVDLYVKIYLSNQNEINSKIKSEIFNIINFEVEIEGQKQALSYAIDLYVQSFVKSLKENKVLIKEIKIIGLNFHNYE